MFGKPDAPVPAGQPDLLGSENAVEHEPAQERTGPVAIERLRRGDDLRSIVDDSPLAANLERTRAAMAASALPL